VSDGSPAPTHAGRSPIARLDRAEGPKTAAKATFGFVALMASLGAINAFSTDIVIPAMGAIAAEFALDDPNQRQWVLLTVFVGVAISQLFIGPIADRYGRRPAAAINIATFIAGTLIALFAPSFTVLLLGRLLQGLGAGGLRVISMSVTRDRFSGDEMARVMSLSSGVFVIMILLAPAVGQAVISVLDWRWVFAVLLAQAAITAAWFFGAQPETLRPEHRRPLSFRGVAETFLEVVGNRVCMGYALALSCVFGSFVSYLATSQQILEDIYGLGALLPVAFGALALVNGLGSFGNARIVRRVGARRMARWALIATAASGLIGGLGFAVAYDGVPPLWMHLTWAAIPVAAFAVLYGNLAAIALEPMGARAGAASAVVAALGSGAGVVFATVAGGLFDGTVVPLYLTFGLAGVAGYVSIRTLGREVTA
jgi:DHA1 family bicyclomycin/chloramphenicol resistance-like MFS transporter